jgi:hypothetical protein
VSVEGLDAGQDLAVVSYGYQDLGVAADGGLEDREGAGGELSRSVSGLMGVQGGV